MKMQQIVVLTKLYVYQYTPLDHYTVSTVYMALWFSTDNTRIKYVQMKIQLYVALTQHTLPCLTLDP